MYRIDFKATPEYGDSSTGTITYDQGVFIYDVNSFSLNADQIADGTLTEKFGAGDINTLTLKIYRESLTGTQAHKDAQWRDLAAQRCSLRLYNTVLQEYVFEGRISAAEENMDSSGKVYKSLTCESEKAYLADTTVSLAEVYAQEGYNYATSTNLFIGNAVAMIQDIVAIHNAKTGGFAGNISKRFTVQTANYWPNGDYPQSIMFYRSPYVPSGSGTEYLALHQDKELDTMSALAMIQWVAERHGYSVTVKHNPNYPDTDSDNHLILYVEGLSNANRQYGVKASPTIHLRDNMKSLKVTHNFSGAGRVTHIVPLGGVGADGTRMDISSIPQYNPITEQVFYSRAVPNFQLAVTYGTVEKIEIHDDLVDDGNKTAAEIDAMRTTLYNRGIKSSMELNDKVTSVQVSALDLAQAGENVDAFEVGYSYEIINEMLDYLSGGSTIAFDKTYQLLQKVTPLARPWAASFVFGEEVQTVNKKNLSAQLALKQQGYNTSCGIAGRLDNAAIKLCADETEYNGFGTHRAETLYTVPQSNGETWLYKGDERIVISGGGGGDSFTIDYASVLSAEQSVTYTTGQTIAIAAQCGMTAIYGGSPSRGVCNGYRVLFNVPYADITQQDVSSYFVLNTGGSGQYAIYRVRFYSQTVSAFTLRLFATQYNADGTVASSTTRDYDYSYSGDLSGLTFGATADYSTITEGSSSQQAAGVYGQYSGKGDGLSGNMNIVIKAWLDGVALTPTSRNTSTVFSNTCNIKSLAEYHFDLSLNKRYEPSGGV